MLGDQGQLDAKWLKVGKGSPSGLQPKCVTKNHRGPMCHLGIGRIDDDDDF